ncbi:hypothetical protein DBR32_04310 [Taibaiella sp. KBW10]|uniref:hypothetical protein n=1 Tax=Taibaiella sp. KBW10 TaxID=2153357 RepID=UPI000F59FA83|nr:hypothetical protein [Taibaiella sp. KBW10]RQO31198.1 hypothetical protein DBR32_04310 [Taibaiella sp. KBW10]
MTIKTIRTYILRRNYLKFLFFGNYFYALCALALCLESLFTLNIPFFDGHYLAIMFLGVIVFYTNAYRSLKDAKTDSVFQNPFYVQRTLWYIKNDRLVRAQQFLWAAVILFAALYYYIPIIRHQVIAPLDYAIISGALLLAFSYIGYGRFNIRRYGVLKPLVISLLWTMTITVLPVMSSQWLIGSKPAYSPLFMLLCLYNTLYILQLCILFDIKDYAVDARSGLRTFVVSLGLKKTIRFVLIPLYILSILLVCIMAWYGQYTIGQTVLSLLPLLGLWYVVRLLRRPQPLLFYLFIVDGLMLLKGLVGILVTFL